ncbi:kinase-like domain-containing protein [Multifurca ochricompacta]|uniref:Kinase-like domain-containing protein n=1 Tax=Multifurca ochricompacta TaxID=376703 RepID=A0AAD4QLC5_9AGAM|nr:kinase-like domain-containing protein [Multifurca ochricompacta]
MTSISLRTHLTYGEQANREIGTLFGSELWWRDNYSVIWHSGYELRPRYHPNWEPSWRRSGKDFFSVEDGQPCLLRAAIDATRRADGKRVMLKKILPEEGPYELDISRMFSSPELAQNPRNHCVPLLDIIELPNSGQRLMVMPFLRPFNKPRFQTFGEFVAFFTQICEGLQFMHERNIAHRDCTANNIMFDPSGMYPQGFHPLHINRSQDFKGRAKHYTRTQQPPRYHLIDFGLSRQYTSRRAFDRPLRGGDKSAPEHKDGGWCNPFQTDIYYLGNLVRQEFLRKYNGFEFMNDLVSEMTHRDPAKRPIIEVVVDKFAHICESLSGFKLRSNITSKRDPTLFSVFRHARQATRTLQYIVLCKAAIPET